ncbi:hypothetical protein LDG_7763 [Legionella drancourtii LLAP12]|uniref:T2SS substrate NttA domain-containing protein n=1 Tax=Legionella drancourtii LLAP12 TaxID=658187 RepID=G9ER52_9GAMM|nr:hypothetical protein [Legionella drancourtii]EHL30253.1 hypothetical protein LDG_7763 [Legionella drancourtii LLAP12]
MQKQSLIAISMLLGSGLACANTTAPSTTATPAAAPITAPATAPSDASFEMSKATWLTTIVPMLPSLICKGFMGDPDLKQRLDAIKMSYEQCVSAIPESVSKCQNQLYASIPEQISSTDAATWGKKFGECIGKDFAMKYLLPK